MDGKTEDTEQTKPVSPDASPFISVIVVNYNSGTCLKKCLDALYQQTFRDFDVTVVDNASTDGSIQSALQTSATVIHLDENIGFAAANNKAALSVRGQWLAFLNPDAYAKSDWLEAFVQATKKYPKIDAFGSKQLDASDPSKLDGAGDCCSVYGIPYRSGTGLSASEVNEDRYVFAPCAAAAFYLRTTFMSLEGFDERFFCYGEDVDLGFRLRVHGGSVMQLANACVTHEGSAVTGRHSPFSVYHGHRNRVWLYYKSTPMALYIATLPLRVIGDVCLFLKHLLGGRSVAYLRGMRDGYMQLGRFQNDRRRIAPAFTSAMVVGLFVWSPLSVALRRLKTVRG